MNDGHRADSERADSERADGERADGERADGERADGERADGERADGERAAPWEQVASAVRDGWHAAGGGRSQDCPGCPVCRLADATAVPPQTREHLDAALGHALSAGRELLAVFGGAGQATRGGTDAEPTRPDGAAPQTRETDARPVDGGVSERVRIHVDHQEDTE